MPAETGCSQSSPPPCGCDVAGTGDAHAHPPPARVPAGRPGGDPVQHHHGCQRGRAAGKPRVGAAPAGRGGRPLPARARWAPPRWPTAAASTSPAIWATATPTSRTPASRPRQCSTASAGELDRRYAGTAPRGEARERLREELGLIAHHGWPGSSCFTATSSRWHGPWRCGCAGRAQAATCSPPGRGRGSSVGSIVCYLIGLSHVDPIATRLFLGRFLSKDLASVPDIDLDFPRDVREGLMIDVIERYGPEHAALVAAFPTYRVARLHPRPRQGAGAAAGRDRADGAAGRLVGRTSSPSRSRSSASGRTRRAGRRSRS